VSGPRCGPGLASSLLVVAAMCAGCEGTDRPQGPAVEIALQIVRAADDVDTSDITGFLVRVGDEEQAIEYDPTRALALELVSPPAPATAFVVFGCTLPNAACSEPFGVFVGCVVVDLAPSEEPVIVTVALDERAPLPSACVGLVDPRSP
jgi:hypothetical protein